MASYASLRSWLESVDKNSSENKFTGVWHKITIFSHIFIGALKIHTTV
jgi:hypothetical protein